MDSPLSAWRMKHAFQRLHTKHIPHQLHAWRTNKRLREWTMKRDVISDGSQHTVDGRAITKSSRTRTMKGLPLVSASLEIAGPHQLARHGPCQSSHSCRMHSCLLNGLDQLNAILEEENSHQWTAASVEPSCSWDFKSRSTIRTPPVLIRASVVNIPRSNGHDIKEDT